MKLEFATTRLAKECVDDRSRLRTFGADRAKKLGQRLTLIEAAASMEQLRNAPGHFHELVGDRKGQFAASLDEPYRLIFMPVLDDAASKVHEKGYVWSQITHVRILSILDYHG